MDNALQNAIKTRDALMAQIKTLQAELSKAEAFIELHGHFAASSAVGQPGVAIPPIPSGIRMTATLQKIRIVDVAAEILAQRSPLKTQDVLKALDERGYRVGGEDRLVNLSSMLSRDERFKNKRGEGWSLSGPEKAMPSPAATELGI